MAESTELQSDTQFDAGGSPEEQVLDVKLHAKWQARIRRAKKLREDWERDFHVEECENFYLGKQRAPGDNSSRVLNHFLSIVRVTQPNLLFDDPKFLVRSKPGRSPLVENQADVAEGVLEAVTKQDQNLQNAARLALLQTFFRAGVLKIIYDPRFESNPQAGEPILQRDPDGNPVRGPMGEPMPEIDPSTGGPVLESDFIISDEAYRFEWVDAKNMLFPNEGPDMSKWTWVGEQIEVTLQEAREDERFPDHLKAHFKPSGKSEDRRSEHEEIDESSNPDDQPFRYTEVYDIKTKRWMIWAEDEGFKEPLLDQPLPDGVEDHPYAIMPGWIPILGPEPLPWPLPYTQPWLDPQREYNIRRQQMMEGAKRSARKLLFEANTFADEQEALKALQSSKDMEAAMVTDLGRPPVMMEQQDLNPAIYNDIPALMNDYRIISGQTGAKLGNPDSDTATEASFVERASQLRDSDLQKDVVRWLRTAGQKMFQRVRATLTLEMWVNLRGMDDRQITNFMVSSYKIPPDMVELFPSLKEGIVHRFGQERPFRVDRNKLQFEADIDIIPGSTRPRSLAVERSQWLEFLQIIAQAPHIALSFELLKETAKKFEFISDRTVEEIHMLAMQMMQMQANQAGRGGAGTASQNTPGTESQDANALLSQVAQGFEQAQ